MSLASMRLHLLVLGHTCVQDQEAANQVLHCTAAQVSTPGSHSFADKAGTYPNAELQQHACLSQAMMFIPRLQTTVTTTQLVTSATSPTVTISFGGRVLELNPVKLYTLTGVDRTDTVYNVDTGTIYVTAYLPDGSSNTDIM